MDLSVIVPTLNEAEHIVTTIKHARSMLSGDFEVEFILIDAGSQDGTLGIAQSFFDKCHNDVLLAGLKYSSMNVGASMATGEVLLFLDADCLVPRDYDRYILCSLLDKEVVGGAFEFQMNTKKLVYKIVEKINRLRYRITRNYFGDQGVFCRKAIFGQIGGFPEEPIMESAYLCQKLRKLGTLKLIRQPIISSVRRFEESGLWGVLWYDLRVWMNFLMNRKTIHFASKYWEQNENRK